MLIFANFGPILMQFFAEPKGHPVLETLWHNLDPVLEIFLPEKDPVGRSIPIPSFQLCAPRDVYARFMEKPMM